MLKRSRACWPPSCITGPFCEHCDTMFLVSEKVSPISCLGKIVHVDLLLNLKKMTFKFIKVNFHYGLSYGVCVFLCLAILVEHRLVTDRQTDTQTDRHTTMAYTALAQRRAVKNEF